MLSQAPTFFLRIEFYFRIYQDLYFGQEANLTSVTRLTDSNASKQPLGRTSIFYFIVDNVGLASKPFHQP